MGMLLGSRTATGPSGLARFAIPGPVRPLGGVRGFGFRSWWWFENWRVDASKKDFLFLFTVFSDELLLVEVLFFVLIVL